MSDGMYGGSSEGYFRGIFFTENVRGEFSEGGMSPVNVRGFVCGEFSRGIFHGRNVRENCPGGYLDPHAALQVSIRAAVIRATLVNTQTHIDYILRVQPVEPKVTHISNSLPTVYSYS